MNTLDIQFVMMVCAVLGVFGGIFVWLWRHSTRLTQAEVRIEGLGNRMDLHSQDVSNRLASIEAKLDRVIEREIGHP